MSCVRWSRIGDPTTPARVSHPKPASKGPRIHSRQSDSPRIYASGATTIRKGATQAQPRPSGGTATAVEVTKQCADRWDSRTVIEAGIKGFEVVGFYGFLAPAGLPKDIIAKLSDAFKQVMTNPEVRNRMITQGADPAFLGSEEFAQFLASETPRWAQAVKTSGAKLD